MPSNVVARLAFDGTMAGRRVVLTGLRNHVAAAIGRYLPRAFTAGLVRRIQMARLTAGD
jgi:short-subunit dehydrogenase